MKHGKKILGLICILIMGAAITSCGKAKMAMKEMAGNLSGNSYIIKMYDNSGNLWFTAKGEKIRLDGIETSEDGDLTMSSYVATTIDGHEMETCGSTMVFAEKGLEPVEIEIPDSVETEDNGFFDNTFIARTLNEYKNAVGKAQVIVIQGQLGNPIEVYQGNEVTKEIAKDLPKTTRCIIDGKMLYVHRANVSIFDAELLGLD